MGYSISFHLSHVGYNDSFRLIASDKFVADGVQNLHQCIYPCPAESQHGSDKPSEFNVTYNSIKTRQLQKVNMKLL